MAKFDFLNSQLDQLKSANLYRSLTTIDSPQGPVVQIKGQSKILFCSNNYLNLANHPAVCDAVATAVKKFGYAAAASRLISGTMSPHVQLEKSLAELFQKPAALIFPSGFTANEAVIRTIPQKGDLLLLDKLDHASIIDAANASPAEFRTYRRGNYKKLEKFLADSTYNQKFIITETIFSMDGDTADLKTLVELKNKYNAILIVDEAHAFGCLGKNGAGLAEQLGLLDQIDIAIATMSKALGVTGGIVAANKNVIEFLINKARAFIYTTAPSPANCQAALAAIEILKNEPERKDRLKKNADYLRQKLNQLGLDTSQSTTHIIPVIVKSETKALDLSKKLFDMGFFIPAIRPPTVAPGTARLRISIQCDHTTEQLDALCSALKQLITETS